MTQPNGHALRRALLALAAALALSLFLAPAAFAGPIWNMEAAPESTVAESPGTMVYDVWIENRGNTAAEGSAEQLEFSGTLPAGMTIEGVFGLIHGGWSCSTAAQSFTCIDSSDSIGLDLDSRVEFMLVIVNVEPGVAEGTLLSPSFTISGGGAASLTSYAPTRISSTPASFGVSAFDIKSEATDGSPFTQAGGHVDDFTTAVDFNTRIAGEPFGLQGQRWPVEPVGDVVVDVPPGLIANPNAVGKCTTVQLFGDGNEKQFCPIDSQIGTIDVRYGGFGLRLVRVAVFNMVPVPGEPARFGFIIAGSLVMLDTVLRSDSDYGVSVKVADAPQTIAFNGQTVTLWNDPSDSSHDAERACPGGFALWGGGGTCPAGSQGEPFLRLPTSCSGPLPYAIHGDSWWNKGRETAIGLADLSDPAWKSRSIVSHQLPGYPASPEDPATPWGTPQGMTGCEKVPVRGSLDAKPTALETETSSGIDVHVEVPNPGLENHSGISSSDIKDVIVKLPQGVTINPSQASGLGVCSPAQYESSRFEFHPDGQHGCPSDSKIGTVSIETPLLDETLPGTVYVAKPYENPFGSLIALYMVIEEPMRGILVKQPLDVRLNETTGRIETEVDDIPQLPFSSFDFHFREGARAPLVTPAACGTYTTETLIEGWSDPGDPIQSNSSFQITKGIGGGPCPSGGIPPFKPGLLAGTRNNAAGSYSPFDLRLFRSDAEQQFTNFSIKLPPGVIGKLAGLTSCSDAAVQAAKARSGAEELASPSCPESSYVGRTLVGAGVGSVQTYVPGRIYLAGPYNGSQLSIAAITAAKAGPFDLGTVVVRQALRIDPSTAEVFIDATGSDPLPHIIDGITTHIRDIRAYVDRPDFVLNPTSCDPTSTASTVLGSGLDFVSDADDEPVTVSTRFQAANCLNLGFKPKLNLSLLGGTKRGANPMLRAVLRMRGESESNIARGQVTLPRSAFLDQEHIRTVCTRVQYKADACPAGSVYGYARAWTPLLDEPLQGPVYLRSSENKLPDLVAGLKNGKIEIDLVGRIDSFGNGRIRNTFESVPDAPVTRFVLTMQGGRKGLITNSTNLCRGKHRALVAFDAHNGKIRDSRPPVRAQCGKKKQKRAKRALWSAAPAK